VEKYGCVLYPVAVLSALCGEGSVIYPVSHVRKCDNQSIQKILSGMRYVNTTYLSSTADQGDVINLYYVDQNKRLEKQTGFMNPIVPDDIKELLGCDAFVFVPVTDFETSLGVLQYIKANSKGVVIFDAHGPTNGCTYTGNRFLQFWVDRDLWLPYIDILKMNLEEAGCSWFQKEYAPEEIQAEEKRTLSMDELPRFARHCLSHGVKALYITLDEMGCMLYFQKNGKIKEQLIKRVQVEHVVDTTGCGDSFAGGLAFGYLKTQDYVQACYYANAMGAQRCAGIELNIYKDLRETEEQIANAYGD
jgi:adenosine kinase